ncbi:MAG TPA: DUF4416 family protein [Pirellulales bacterium]|jgi:hypothetical protein|nr:DUF4416 family protein [Pirellulales bacterium]
MGNPTPHAPVLRLLAVIARHQAALDWARDRVSAAWGPIALESPTFAFDETTYYEPTMGAGLGKAFLAFERLADAGELADWKFATNDWEAEYAAFGRHDEPRPLNLDPGYLTPAKLVLASTKDHAHRMYLGRGMYAEVTLFYRRGGWQHHEFTFPDYRRADYQAFFSQARERLRSMPAKHGLP